MPPILKLLFRFVPAFGLVAALVWPACLLVQADIRLRALAALGGFGQPGLAVSVEGRNLRLSGQASRASSLLDARKGLAGVDGVRILLVSASVESPTVPSDPVEMAPIEPVAVAYLVNDEPTRPEPALVLPVRVVPEPAARKLRRALPVP
ncbi:MAG: hypothetical protein NWR47_06110, partial [Aestuariivirgaceae bacterium]|nr:hypothetical protein [Aestuariivirgaceae bacterium]